MVFNITLIGKTNVGKSTLFNKLIKKNLAIIHDSFDFTRDRQFGVLKLKNQNVNIIDTAGFQFYNNQLDILKKNILNQTLIAIKDSILILFILNIKIGITEEDKIIINIIRKQSKEIFLIINKIDKIKNYQYIINEYYCLGIKNIFLISALKNIGLQNLKNKINHWIQSNIKLKYLNNFINKKKYFINNRIISIIGKPNVGKSTLFNTLLNKNRAITSHISGTTRDTIFDLVVFKNKQYKIIDTAGIKKKNKGSKESLPIIKTLQAISHSYISILIIDAKHGFNKKDIWILNIIINSGKILLILINKSENLSLIEKKKIKKYLYSKYRIMKFFYIHFISALYKKGIKKIFSLIDILIKKSNQKMKSSQLTKILYQAILKNPPALFQGKKIKLKYAHPGGYNPPTIVIHGNQLLNISKSYKRYLINFFQERLCLFGKNIKIIFKNTKNPYL